MSRWIFESGPDFFVALFGNAVAARRNLQLWICRSNSEFSGLSATLGFDGAKPVGMILALPGYNTVERRQADLKALIKDSTREHHAGLKKYLPTFAAATAPVEKSDFYLRTLAVEAKHRGRGFGRLLLQRAVSDGSIAGFSRFRLDVQTDNQAAITLYRSLGFEVISEGMVPDFGFAMYSMLLEK